MWWRPAWFSLKGKVGIRGQRRGAVLPHPALSTNRPADPCTTATDVVLGRVGVEWDLRALQHPQQLSLAPMKAGKQPVQHHKTGSAGEEAVKPRPEGAGPAGARVCLPRLEVAVEPPDQLPCRLNGLSLSPRRWDQLMNQALGVNPAQGVGAQPELAGVVGHDHGAAQQPMMADRAPQRALGRDRDRWWGHAQGVDPERAQVCPPGRLVWEGLDRMRSERFDHRAGQLALAHVAERLVVDHVVLVTRA